MVITVYQDKSFTFITKSPPASVLLKKAAGIASGSKTPNKDKVGKVTRKQVMDIVKLKMKDMNATNEEAAFRVVAGTARSMGIEVQSVNYTTQPRESPITARLHRTNNEQCQAKDTKKRWNWWISKELIR